MAMPKWLNKEKSIKDKSVGQERGLAKKLRGRVTGASGACHWDKSDVHVKHYLTQFEPKAIRIECKRTDKGGLYLDKSWIEKLKRETTPKEFWAMELEVSGEKVYVISPGEFEFLSWMLTHSVEDIVKKFQC